MREREEARSLLELVNRISWAVLLKVGRPRTLFPFRYKVKKIVSTDYTDFEIG